MAKPTTKTVGDVTITKGAISFRGKRVGRVDYALQHGYHPSVLLKLDSGFSKWYEMDTPEILDVVFAEVAAQMKLAPPVVPIPRRQPRRPRSA